MGKIRATMAGGHAEDAEVKSCELPTSATMTKGHTNRYGLPKLLSVSPETVWAWLWMATKLSPGRTEANRATEFLIYRGNALFQKGDVALHVLTQNRSRLRQAGSFEEEHLKQIVPA